MTQISIDLDDARLSNMRALLRKRRSLEDVVDATNRAYGRHAVPNGKIHKAIDETRAVIDSDIVKLIISQLESQVADIT